jgi:hypothetical protein
MDMKGEAETREVHEVGLLNAVSPSQRHRMSELLKSTKSRKKLSRMLAHSFKTDAPGWTHIEASKQSAEEIAALLQSAAGGTRDCYCISENPAIDRQFLQVHAALSIIVGYGFGTILSVRPESLLYYEGEEAGQRFIWSPVTCNLRFEAVPAPISGGHSL